MKTATETSIVNSIIRYLKTLETVHGARVVVRKRHGGRFGYSGDPDIYGTINGRHFEFEVKQPGQVPRPLQLRRIMEWRDAGAITGWVTSVEEVKAILSEQWTQPKRLPLARELTGSDPYFVGKLTTDAYIRSIRD